MGLIPDNLMPSPEEARRIIEDLLKGTPEPAKDSVIATSYKDIMFESVAYRDPGVMDKALFSFDASLVRLKQAGFERHARPQEVFGLIVDGLEGKLAGGFKGVYDDMLLSYGEWLSLAVKREGDVLVAYVDPKNLVFDKGSNNYIVCGGQVDCVGKETFSIKGKQSETWIDLKQFEDKFVKFMYSRSFNQLPEIMREGNLRARVYLPSEGVVRPVARGFFNGRFNVGSYYYSNGASRGTSLVAQKISIGQYEGGFF